MQNETKNRCRKSRTRTSILDGCEPGDYHPITEEGRREEVIDKKKLGVVFRNLREDIHINGRQLSIERLSDKSGLGTTTIQSIEYGKANPSLFTLDILCQALGVKLSIIVAQAEHTT